MAKRCGKWSTSSRESSGCLPDVIGHRLVNGGPTITDRSLVDDAVWAELVACQDLAPIHNPPAIATIQACRQVFPGSAAGRGLRHRIPSDGAAARANLRDSSRHQSDSWASASTATTGSVTSTW